MPTVHPLRALGDILESKRLEAVEELAAASAPSPEAVRDLAALQVALTAVREVIEEHAIGLGGAGDEEQVDQAALELKKRH